MMTRLFLLVTNAVGYLLDQWAHAISAAMAKGDPAAVLLIIIAGIVCGGSLVLAVIKLPVLVIDLLVGRFSPDTEVIRHDGLDDINQYVRRSL